MRDQQILDLDAYLRAVASQRNLRALRQTGWCWAFEVEGLVHDLARAGRAGTPVYAALNRLSDALRDLADQLDAA